MKNTSDVQLLQYGFGFIRNIVKNESLLTKINGKELISVILKITDSQVKSADVLNHCIAILGIISREPVMNNEIIKQDGIKLLMNLVKEFNEKGDEKLLTILCQTLLHLAYYNGIFLFWKLMFCKEDMQKEMFKLKVADYMTKIAQHENKQIQKFASQLIQIIVQNGNFFKRN